LNEKKRTGKSHKSIDSKLRWRRISPICGEAPTEAMYMKICLIGDVLDVITCAKFQNEIFRGYDFTGVEFFHFPIDFLTGLTAVQRYCVACDLMIFKIVAACHLAFFKFEILTSDNLHVSRVT